MYNIYGAQIIVQLIYYSIKLELIKRFAFIFIGVDNEAVILSYAHTNTQDYMEDNNDREVSSQEHGKKKFFLNKKLSKK